MSVTDFGQLDISDNRRQQQAGTSFRRSGIIIKLTHGVRLSRIIGNVVGLSLIFMAVFMWVTPGQPLDPDLVPFKAGATVVLLFFGIFSHLFVAVETAGPEAHFDPQLKELRVTRTNGKGRQETFLRRSYASLGGIYLGERSVQVYDTDGALLVDLPLYSRDARALLRQELSGQLPILS